MSAAARPLTVIMPECAQRGCTHEGSRYMMVCCRQCNSWFCPDHLASGEPVIPVRMVRPGFEGMSFYTGLCANCAQTPADPQFRAEAWLR